MSKNKDKNALGRSLIKSRFANKANKLNSESLLHTSEVLDQADWNKLNLRSITEQDSFKEFLSTAELAGTDFTAEKLNVAFVHPKSLAGLLTQDEIERVQYSFEENKNLLEIPRRPNWDVETTAEKLQQDEKEVFLQWRKRLALFQEKTGLLLTPYEKNLDFWRQLWRVVERSDVVVQIVDARNPLLFRCEDLEKYAKEIDANKGTALLCNKGDFLTGEQRRIWAKYFDSIGVRAVFFSATACEDSKGEEEDEGKSDSNDYKMADVKEDGIESFGRNCGRLLTREELIEFFRTLPRKQNACFNKQFATIGLVGYPNVGKSSTINALLQYKKVPVSATPGKTKHFQTLHLDKDILLCDCPGLVMPSFVLTKADMILNGILPIDEMRDHVPPVNTLCRLIPIRVLENKYGMLIPKPDEGEDPDRPPFAEEVLNAYAYNRGFMTANGEPDNPRASRYILKDFVHGKLLYCYPPPGHDGESFQAVLCDGEERQLKITDRALRAIKPFKVGARDVEYARFHNNPPSCVHKKGRVKYNFKDAAHLDIPHTPDGDKKEGSTWKNHKGKRNRHVKLRKQYGYLDK